MSAGTTILSEGGDRGLSDFGDVAMGRHWVQRRGRGQGRGWWKVKRVWSP